MLLFEAMDVLGLSFSELSDESAIRRMWKLRIKKAHPDKNQGEDTTELTQRLNEAKDMLLDRVATSTEYTSHYDRAKTAAAEAQRQAEKERAAEGQRQAEKDRFEEECDALYKKMREVRRERYAKNRKKRAPGSRIHRKIDAHEEGRVFVEEMQHFFRDRFTSEPHNKLLVCDILDLFVKSRGATSELELNLFKRHSKKQFLASWPDSGYSTLKNKRCFLHVAVRK